MNTSIGSEYDFESEENASKWKGLLTAALKKVLEQVHPKLGATEEALDYVESLCLRLLGMLCAKPSPHSVQDVEYRVQNTFPTPIDKWALKEAQEALERGKKKSVLLLPVDRIHHLMQKELLLYKVDSSVSLFLVAVLEYISADILKLVGNYAKNIKHLEITYQDVQISMKVDKALMDMFYQDEGGGNFSERLNEKLVLTTPRTSLTYEETVRELIASEKVYLKELHMIIKVFREEIKKLTQDPKDIELIFSNVMDIYELTYTLTGSLEDVMEMAQEQMPYIGTCFEELAEAREFDVYCKYGRDVTSLACRQTLLDLLSRQQATLSTAGQGMHLALKYYLPALLTHPIWHFFSYMDYIRLLIGLSPAPEDKEMLVEVEGMLRPLRDELKLCVPSQPTPRGFATLNQVKARRSAAIEKIQELERVVENWDSKDLGQCCNEFIREDLLTKVTQKRLTERRVFLFDGLMVLCKPTASSRRQSSVHHTSHTCRLKERFFMRKVEIKDHEDTDEVKNAFEILPRQSPSVVLCAKSAEEKNSLLADLVMLNNRSMLERVLDSILSRIEQQHPLKLPPPELYKFAEPDSNENIILEQLENGGGVPLIKGATLYKLVERLTYHIYADPKFVRTFLTTYRSFCSPNTLLELLIERFNIPDASKVYEQDPADADKIQKSSQREDWKKYKKEYCQPIQFRVLNVLRHWVDHHFYDFERDAELLKKMEDFLDSVAGQNMKKWVDSVKKTIRRKKENDNQRHKNVIAFAERPPPIEWHLPCTEEDYGILTLHPLEIARQLTLIEFDLYRMIKPSELVGSVWTKKNKEVTSPNLLKMIKHTTNFTRWLEKNIVEAENFDERVAIVNRICEIMIALNEMNNFTGVLAISSATQSAAVHRLKFTFHAVTQHYKKVLDEYGKVDDHFKKYQEKLRSINPPCVPFLGMYLSNILHIEEGNSDHLPGTNLINFFKRRKVAEITGEIQQYQNQPYCFKVEPQIKNFLENLNPFGDMSDTDIQNYLYQKSMEIEPRGAKQLPKFPRKWAHLSLKSPGIKPKRSAGSVVANAVNTMSSTLKGDESKSEDSSKSDNDFSVFAPVQLGTGQYSPTHSPNSPAGPSNPIMQWFNHARCPSVSSVISTTSYRPARTSEIGSSVHLSYHRHPQATTSTGAPGSPGAPNTPTSPHSPQMPPTPPPLPPRKRRDSPETLSPQSMQAPDAPLLPPKDQSPPPLPPRRDPAVSPNQSQQQGGTYWHTLPHPHSHHHPHPPPVVAPRLRPTHASQLHMRRHAHVTPRTNPVQLQTCSTGSGGASILGAATSPAKPPTVSPRYGSSSTSESGSEQITPQLPPKPAVRSAGPSSGTMFQYPSTTNT
ncbi:protein son of sevenless [Anthonomus grandis grandis]|uniref:protein son of sevenless n=1 Tax=Anthonomus grandis grandis TaxID=2921223 RepID=UPI00216662A7|nr:protein son of sevenless [Anthonomus grandis grandis]XP_050310450.1 protein son of sevenless [Anthonomus grandis grandis]